MPDNRHDLAILADPQRAPAGARARVRRWLRLLSPAQWLALLALAGTGVAAFGIAPSTKGELAPGRLVAVALPLPELAQVEPLSPLWREERVQRGDTIGSLLARAGVADPKALDYLRTDRAARALYQLRPGRPVRLAIDDEGRLAELRFVTPPGELLAITRDGERFEATSVSPPIEVRQVMRAGEIQTSLFAAADDAGIPDAITHALAEVFAADIDFLRDIRRGDRFAVVYEMRYIDGEPTGTGRILAAEFVNAGTTLRAFYWRHDDGEEGYYTEDGASRRKAFLRSPMEFSRVTSGYSLARFHPILQTWRAHRGIDYAAPTGTPVRATGDGVVAFAGVGAGYGNVVVVRHAGDYTTLYAHLSRFVPGLRVGARVRQGQTIAFVGATGWATGPHLHYEFRLAGKARDPMTIGFPTAVPIPPEKRAQFVAATRAFLQHLAIARSLPAGTLAAAE